MTGQTLTTKVVGKRSALFALATSSFILSVLTLGIYSYWGRTRIRRWLWSSICPIGIPLEYTGQAIEKITGFFVAAAFISVYAGLIVMFFTYLSLEFFSTVWFGYIGAILFLFPIYHLARYRGRRYLVNHTLWRGLKFSMRPKALGYSWRATVYSLLTLFSFGLLEPIGRFQLQKYMIDRIYYGNARFILGGNPWSLYPAFLPFYLGFLSTTIIALYSFYININYIGFLVLSLPLFIFGYLYYKTVIFKKTASEVLIGKGTGFDVNVDIVRSIWIIFVGHILVNTFIALTLPFAFLLLYSVYDFQGKNIRNISTEELPLWVFIFAAFLFYIIFAVYRRYLKTVFITYPFFKYFCQTLTIVDAHYLNGLKQLKLSKHRDADGLAEIFDFGGNI